VGRGFDSLRAGQIPQYFKRLPHSLAAYSLCNALFNSACAIQMPNFRVSHARAGVDKPAARVLLAIM
jgi:hypothetical protein